MNKLTLKIEREDILANSYVDTKNCPITKALQRAGKDKWQDSGIRIVVVGIVDDERITILDTDNLSYCELVTKVMEQYSLKYKDINLVESFEHTLEWE